MFVTNTFIVIVLVRALAIASHVFLVLLLLLATTTVARIFDFSLMSCDLSTGRILEHLFVGTPKKTFAMIVK